MSVVLLRTLTRKSIIGFGNFKDLTVQNLIDTYRTKELLSIYYNCRNIDFNQDLKDELCISGEREINKKEPKEERYSPQYPSYILWCIKLMLEKKEAQQVQNENRMIFKDKVQKKKRVHFQEKALKRTIYSKAANRSNNQWK